MMSKIWNTLVTARFVLVAAFDMFILFAVAMSFVANLQPIHYDYQPLSADHVYRINMLSALIFARLTMIVAEHIFDRYILELVRLYLEKQKNEG